MPGHVTVVGLGPAGVDLLLPAARTALERATVRFVRTERHPAVIELVAEGLAVRSLDEHYVAADDLDAAYAAIVETLRAAAADAGPGEVAYGVPGNPAVAERTVVLLRAAGVEVAVVPGLSFAELAWARLGVDPMAGASVVDGHDVPDGLAGRSGPLLVVQCDRLRVLSAVKLALLDDLPSDHPVVVLRHLGLPDESSVEVALHELDRVVEPDHLTSLFVDTGTVAIAPAFARFYALVERLRGPGGCPWDAAQTHHSLTRHLLEEAYEVVEAIERLPVDAPGGDAANATDEYAALADELGDLLFQVVIHTVLAGEAGAFTMPDVVTGIHEKLVRRHPHVFGSVEADSPGAVVAHWEEIKRTERGGGSLVAGIAPGLPALLFVPKLLRKAEAVGLEPTEVVRSLPTEIAADLDGDDLEAVEDALGAWLAALVVAARARDVDPEAALRGWAARFRDRFVALEQRAEARGTDVRAAGPARVREMWRDPSLTEHTFGE